MASPSAKNARLRAELEATAQRIAMLDGSDAEARASEFTEFKKGILAAKKGSENIIESIEPKDVVLKFLIELYTDKKNYRKQIKPIMQILVLIDVWKEVLFADDGMIHRSMPEELTEALGLPNSGMESSMGAQNKTTENSSVAEAAKKAEEEKRLAREAAKAEKERLAHEVAEAKKAEKERLSREAAKAAQKREEDRLAREAAEAEKERLAQEAADAEQKLACVATKAAPNSEHNGLTKELTRETTPESHEQLVHEVAETAAETDRDLLVNETAQKQQEESMAKDVTEVKQFTVEKGPNGALEAAHRVEEEHRSGEPPPMSNGSPSSLPPVADDTVSNVQLVPSAIHVNGTVTDNKPVVAPPKADVVADGPSKEVPPAVNGSQSKANAALFKKFDEMQKAHKAPRRRSAVLQEDAVNPPELASTVTTAAIPDRTALPVAEQVQPQVWNGPPPPPPDPVAPATPRLEAGTSSNQHVSHVSQDTGNNQDVSHVSQDTGNKQNVSQVSQDEKDAVHSEWKYQENGDVDLQNRSEEACCILQ